VTRVFYDADVDLGQLTGRTVAVIGYGNPVRVQALNMRDSGVERVVVGSVRYQGWETAESDSFSPLPIAEATEAAEISLILVPDEVAPEPTVVVPTKALSSKSRSKLSTPR
jgi:ketol-acid reductoisomerase